MATLELLLLRHADAGDPAAWEGDDAVRPLSAKGRRQADRMGRLLAAAGIRPDAIISSPRLRARETADTVAAHLGLGVHEDPRLAAAFGVAEAAAIVTDAGQPRRPMLVGHDPDFSDLLGSLLGYEGVRLRKGALARVDLGGGRVAAGSGELRWLVGPDILPE
jgi:phosphohistidine phosphatase SixA